jgi:hypothetical protein
MSDKASAKTRVGTHTHGIGKRHACGDEKSSGSGNRIMKDGGGRQDGNKPAMSLYQPIDIDGGDEGEVSHNVR